MNGWSAVPSTESTKIYVLEIDLVRLTKSRSDILGILLNLHQRNPPHIIAMWRHRR